MLISEEITQLRKELRAEKDAFNKEVSVLDARLKNARDQRDTLLHAGKLALNELEKWMELHQDDEDLPAVIGWLQNAINKAER